MFSTTTLIALAAVAGVAYADVGPSTPSGSDVYNEGSTCNIAWTGDSSGVWSGMAIQLMSGDNFIMTPVTTIATDQDGNADGTFDYTCPEVTPNSKIYFYQFTAPNADNTTWTTRFTIAAADGSVTDPENDTQSDGAAIPWGTGTLDDQSAVVAPPSFASSASSGSAPLTTASTAPTTSSPDSTETIVASTTRTRSVTQATDDDDDEETSTRSSTAASSTSTDDGALNVGVSAGALAIGIMALFF